MSARVFLSATVLVTVLLMTSTITGNDSVFGFPLTRDTIIDPQWQRTDTFRVDAKPGDALIAEKGCGDASDPYWTWTPFDNNVAFNGPETCYSEPMPPGAPMPDGAWFRWFCHGNYTHYWFRTSLNIEDKSKLVSVTLFDKYVTRPSNGAQAIAINDNMYLCVNGIYADYGGCSFAKSNFEYTTNPPNRWEKGCHVGIVIDPLVLNLGNLVNGQNEITVLGEDLSARGGLGHLVFKVTLTDTVGISEGVQSRCALPEGFLLSLRCPNPFKHFACVQYALPHACRVRLELYNMAGQRVMRLVNEDEKAGYRLVSVNAGGLADGVYFCRVEADEYVSAVKMVVLRSW